MRSRRQFLSMLGFVGLACSPVAKAQQQTRVWRVGYLTAGSPVSVLGRTYLDAFRLKLCELGYIEGRNLTVDVKGTEEDFSVLPTMAAELARHQTSLSARPHEAGTASYLNRNC
jgi:putative ABC transport system substrate-binding protein